MNSKEVDSLRERARDCASRFKSHSWQMARMLHEISSYRDDKTNESLWQLWGYESFSGYVEAELDIVPSAAYNLRRVYEVMVAPWPSHIGARAMAMSFNRFVPLMGFVRQEKDAVAWLDFAASHTQAEMNQATTAVHRDMKLRVRMNKDPLGSKLIADPPKALAMAGRESFQASIENQKQFVMSNLSKQDKETLAWAVGHSRRVLGNESMAETKALIECLNQFRRLVASGRAGTGWDTPAIQLDPIVISD